MKRSDHNKRFLVESSRRIKSVRQPKGYRLEDMARVRRGTKGAAAFYADTALVEPGEVVKLSFLSPPTVRAASGMAGESMWVEVTKRTGASFEGILRNQPFGLTGVKYGDKIKFQRRHIHSFDNDE